VASFITFGSASPPTARDPPGGASWWSQRATHRGLARRIPTKLIGSKPTQTAHNDGRRSNVRQLPMRPRPTSRVRRGGSADVQQPLGQPGRGVGTSSGG
jgi:hypothetical protein